MGQSKSDKLRTFYSELLSSLHIYADANSRLNLHLPGDNGEEEKVPITINLGEDDQRLLVMPTDDRLQDNQWNGEVPFHPLSESLSRGQSEVLTQLVELVRFVVGHRVGLVYGFFAQFAADESVQKRLSTAQMNYFNSVEGLKDTATLQKLFFGSNKQSKFLLDDEENFFSIFLKRPAEINGKRFARGAIATFPIYKELQTEGIKVADVDVKSKANKRALRQLFENLFPYPSDQDRWSAGAHETTPAPYLRRC
jgi:hypothetical protein